MANFAPVEGEQPDLVMDFLLSLLSKKQGLPPVGPVRERLGVGDTFRGLDDRVKFPISTAIGEQVNATLNPPPLPFQLEPLNTNVTPMPTKPGLPDPVTRNRRGESREALKGAGLAALAGLVFSKGDPRGAIAAAGGFGQGAGRAADANFADRQAQQEAEIAQQGRLWENQVIGAQNTEAARQAGNQGVTARNQNAITGYKLKTDAEKQAAALAAKTATETRAERKEKAARRDRFIGTLKDLSPASQQEILALAEKNGDLSDMGLDVPKDAEGKYLLNVQKAAPQKAAEDPEAIKRKQYEVSLREQYRILANPRLKVGMQHQVLSRIARLEKNLGYGDGEAPENLLDDMTPAQKETFKQRREEAAERARHNKEAEKDKDADRGIAASNLALRAKAMNAQEKREALKVEEKNISDEREANNADRNLGKITGEQYAAREKELDAKAVRVRRILTGRGAPVAEPGQKPKPGQPFRVQSGGTTYIVRPKAKP